MGGRPLALSAPNWPHRGYRLLLRCLSPWLLAWLWWRGRKDAGYRENMAQRLGRIEPTPSSSHGILIHAASVGEVQAAQPLIAALRAHWPDHTITVTTQTPTGARALRSQWGGAIQHLYFPVDTPSATARFLERLQPRLVVLIEREVWPEWMLQCRARDIPVALVNARLSERSAAGYHRLRSLMQPVWRGLTLVAAADGDSGDRLVALGVPPARLILTGNLKFDQAPSTACGTMSPIALTHRPMIVAGSTHEGEETALLDAWPALLIQHPDALLVIVPRHPERFEDVARQIEARGKAFARRSRDEAPDATTSIWLGDTMGELGAWYAQASLCFIGGTLVPVGGHNPLEALAAGKPVLFGPHTHNAVALYNAIAESKAGRRIESAAAALSLAAQWLAEPKTLRHLGQEAQQFVSTHKGSSESTLQALKSLWQPLRPDRLYAIVEHRMDSTTVWHNPNLLGTESPDGIFEPPAKDTLSLAPGSGRGQAQRLTVRGHDVVLRHYRRGGLVGRFNPDRYRLSTPRESRAMREYALLRWMSACGLAVPLPVAARQIGNGKSYTADIIIRMIPATQNLVQRLASAPLNDGQWQAVGRAIRRLHDAQVFHSDLNAHNILLDDHDHVWIVDFDKCETRADGLWKADNLKRLERSLRKESDRMEPFHWKSTDGSPLRVGYLDTSKPPRI
jgi:3-deoxy-D-manno-octulosonic-acid transferase